MWNILLTFKDRPMFIVFIASLITVVVWLIIYGLTFLITELINKRAERSSKTHYELLRTMNLTKKEIDEELQRLAEQIVPESFDKIGGKQMKKIYEFKIKDSKGKEKVVHIKTTSYPKAFSKLVEELGNNIQVINTAEYNSEKVTVRIDEYYHEGYFTVAYPETIDIVVPVDGMYDWHEVAIEIESDAKTDTGDYVDVITEEVYYEEIKREPFNRPEIFR